MIQVAASKAKDDFGSLSTRVSKLPPCGGLTSRVADADDFG